MGWQVVFLSWWLGGPSHAISGAWFACQAPRAYGCCCVCPAQHCVLLNLWCGMAECAHAVFWFNTSAASQPTTDIGRCHSMHANMPCAAHNARYSAARMLPTTPQPSHLAPVEGCFPQTPDKWEGPSPSILSRNDKGDPHRHVPPYCKSDPVTHTPGCDSRRWLREPGGRRCVAGSQTTKGRQPVRGGHPRDLERPSESACTEAQLGAGLDVELASTTRSHHLGTSFRDAQSFQVSLGQARAVDCSLSAS